MQQILQLFDELEDELRPIGLVTPTEESICLYKRLFLDYTVGLGRIYSEAEIEAAKQSYSMLVLEQIKNLIGYQPLLLLYQIHLAL